MTRFIELSAISFALLAPLLAQAHHGKFYTECRQAVRSGKLQPIKHLFTKEAWKGKKGDLSGKEMQDILNQRKYTDYNETSSTDKKRTRCIVLFWIKSKKSDCTRVINFLARRIGNDGNSNAKAWQIVRIVESEKEAKK